MAHLFRALKSKRLLPYTILFVVFVSVVGVIEYYSGKQLEGNLEKYAQFLSSYVWNVDLQGSEKLGNMTLNAERLQKWEIVNPDGKTFLSLVSPIELSLVEKWLLSAHIYREINRECPILYDNKTIGMQRIVKIDKGFWTYLYLFLFFSLLACLLYIFEKFQLSSKSYYEIFNASNDAILVFDPSRRQILDSNEKTLDLFGFPRANMVRLSVSDIFEGEANKPFEDSIRLGPQFLRLRGKQKTGPGFWSETIFKHCKIQGQDRVLAVVRNIDDKVTQEREHQEIQKQLVKTSRYAGMYEVASDVLHNVGNALNSVGVSIEFLRTKLLDCKFQNLSKAIGMLVQNQQHLDKFVTEDPQGKHCLSYIETLADVLSKNRDEIMAELERLSSGFSHIKTTVAAQQSHARVVGTVEKIVVSEVIDEALRMHQEDLERHRIEIVRLFGDRVETSSDRHMILQILVNIIINAKHAMKECKQKRLTITIRKKADSSEAFLVELSDTGMGISSENLTKIFTHGFTTRPDGHGFGLHSACICAKQLGGSLSVASEGVGRGATFTLELPCQV